MRQRQSSVINHPIANDPKLKFAEAALDDKASRACDQSCRAACVICSLEAPTSACPIRRYGRRSRLSWAYSLPVAASSLPYPDHPAHREARVFFGPSRPQLDVLLHGSCVASNCTQFAERNITVRREAQPVLRGTICSSPPICFTSESTSFIPKPLHFATSKPAGSPGPSSKTERE
jgi:hypothetical protein